MCQDNGIKKQCQRRIRRPLFHLFFHCLRTHVLWRSWRKTATIITTPHWVSAECRQDYIPGLNLLRGVSFWKASHSRAGNGIYWSPLTGCLFLWGPRMADSPGNPASDPHSGLIQSWQMRWEAFHQPHWLWRCTSREGRGPFQKQLLPEDQDLSWFRFLNQLPIQLNQSCCTSCCKLPLLSWTQIAEMANHYLGEGYKPWESLKVGIRKAGEWTQKLMSRHLSAGTFEMRSCIFIHR